MSFAKNDPGGGFIEVKGYNPTAGSMADEQRRQREADEQRRQNEESMRRSAEIASQQREWDRDRDRQRASNAARPSGKKAVASPQGAAARKSWFSSSPSSTAQTNPASKRPSRPVVKSGPWNPVFGVVGFVGVAAWVAAQLSGENRLILAAAAGLFGGFVIGKLWRPLLWLGAIGGGLWLWSRAPRGDTGSNAGGLAAPSVSVGGSSPRAWESAPQNLAPESRTSEPVRALPAVSAAQPLPAVVGYLFVEGDVRFDTRDLPGGAIGVVLTHTEFLDHALVRWLQYYAQTGQIIVATDSASGSLEYYDLGVLVPAEAREAWRFAPDVTVVYDRRSAPAITSVKAKYSLGIPEAGSK